LRKPRMNRETRRQYFKQQLANAVFVPFDPWGLHNHQRCRFCKKGVAHVTGLWRYAVRHYVCTVCREKGLAYTFVRKIAPPKKKGLTSVPV
jgi:hypothetical protein